MKRISIAQRIILMIVASVIALMLVGGVGLNVSNQQTNSIRILLDVTNQWPMNDMLMLAIA